MDLLYSQIYCNVFTRTSPFKNHKNYESSSLTQNNYDKQAFQRILSTHLSSLFIHPLFKFQIKVSSFHLCNPDLYAVEIWIMKMPNNTVDNWYLVICNVILYCFKVYGSFGFPSSSNRRAMNLRLFRVSLLPDFSECIQSTVTERHAHE